jgi:phage anti-repressor protein
MNTTNTYNKTLMLLQSRECGTELEGVSIKLSILRDYISSKERADSLSNEALATIESEEFARPDTIFVRDEDGDLALLLPYAEGMLISGVMMKDFRCALGLILIAETCYEPTLGSPSRLNDALGRFQPIVCRGKRVPASLLHEFLEVDEPVESWFSNHLHAHKMVRDRDYALVPREKDLAENLRLVEGMNTALLAPTMVEKIACNTPTLRGRKLKACLIHPGVNSCDFAEYDPALLEVLFSPPARGLHSL